MTTKQRAHTAGRRTVSPGLATNSSIFRPTSATDATVCDDEAVLFNRETGVYYGLDEVGTLVWSALEGHGTAEAIVAHLLERFGDADPVQVHGDVERLLGELHSEGLIETVKPAR